MLRPVADAYQNIISKLPDSDSFVLPRGDVQPSDVQRSVNAEVNTDAVDSRVLSSFHEHGSLHGIGLAYSSRPKTPREPTRRDLFGIAAREAMHARVEKAAELKPGMSQLRALDSLHAECQLSTLATQARKDRERIKCQSSLQAAAVALDEQVKSLLDAVRDELMEREPDFAAIREACGQVMQARHAEFEALGVLLSGPRAAPPAVKPHRPGQVLKATAPPTDKQLARDLTAVKTFFEGQHLAIPVSVADLAAAFDGLGKTDVGHAWRTRKSPQIAEQVLRRYAASSGTAAPHDTANRETLPEQTAAQVLGLDGAIGHCFWQDIIPRLPPPTMLIFGTVNKQAREFIVTPTPQRNIAQELLTAPLHKAAQEYLGVKAKDIRGAGDDLRADVAYLMRAHQRLRNGLLDEARFISENFFDKSKVSFSALSADGRRRIEVSADGNNYGVHVYDIDDSKAHDLKARGAAQFIPKEAEFSADGKYVWAMDRQYGDHGVFDIESSELYRTPAAPFATFVPGQSQLLLLRHVDHDGVKQTKFSTFDWQTGQEQILARRDGEFRSAVFDPTGQTLACSKMTGSIDIFTTRAELVGSRQSSADRLLFAPDGDCLVGYFFAPYLYGYWNGAKSVDIFSIDDDNFKGTLQFDYHVLGTCFTPDSRVLAVATTKALHLFDRKDWVKRLELAWPAPSLTYNIRFCSMAFAPRGDGLRVVLGSWSGSNETWKSYELVFSDFRPPEK